jgi:hypothetical protein
MSFPIHDDSPVRFAGPMPQRVDVAIMSAAALSA